MADIGSLGMIRHGLQEEVEEAKRKYDQATASLGQIEHIIDAINRLAQENVDLRQIIRTSVYVKMLTVLAEKECGGQLEHFLKAFSANDLSIDDIFWIGDYEFTVTNARK